MQPLHKIYTAFTYKLYRCYIQPMRSLHKNNTARTYKLNRCYKQTMWPWQKNYTNTIHNISPLYLYMYKLCDRYIKTVHSRTSNNLIYSLFMLWEPLNPQQRASRTKQRGKYHFKFPENERDFHEHQEGPGNRFLSKHISLSWWDKMFVWHTLHNVNAKVGYNRWRWKSCRWR